MKSFFVFAYDILAKSWNIKLWGKQALSFDIIQIFGTTKLLLTFDWLLLDTSLILPSVCTFFCLIQTFLRILSICLGLSGMVGFFTSKMFKLSLEQQELPSRAENLCMFPLFNLNEIKCNQFCCKIWFQLVLGWDLALVLPPLSMLLPSASVFPPGTVCLTTQIWL